MFKPKIKINRLDVIIFVSGASVMILELIGSRILAPFLGTSIFVWASLIGIILGALSLGYHLGGKFSQTNPNFNFLTKIIFLAGLSILLITVTKDVTLILTMQLGVRLGSAIATLVLFTIPSILLGMVSPYAIRLKVQRVDNTGGVAGNLYALSTIGSIFGTFLAGFYLIPTFGSTQILIALSLALIITSFLAGKKMLKVYMMILAMVFWFNSLILPSMYVYQTDSAYNHIRVVDSIDSESGLAIRELYLATERHSIIFEDSDDLYSKYHKLYQLDSLFKPNIKSALTLGGGAYIAPRNFLSRFPEATMTVVEIDPQVTETAIKYFRLENDQRLTVFHQDGRIFLNDNQKKFDVIYGDAFASFFSIPFQLTTKEALTKIYDSLTDDGILILNVISAIEGEKSMFFQAQYLTLRDVFKQIYIFPAHYYDGQNTTEHQNIILIATKNSHQLTKEELLTKANDTQKKLLEKLWENEITIDPKIKVLTDNFAPVDYYISKLL